MSEGADTRIVGHVAADLMEVVSGEFGDDATVEAVAIVVEVRHLDERAGEMTTITCSSSDHRAWAQSGLLRFAAELVERRALS
jgi:hypothetical protein